MGKPPPTAPFPAAVLKTSCPAAKKSRYTLKIWKFSNFHIIFCFVSSFQMVLLSEVVGNRRVEGLQNSQKNEFRLGFFWGGLPVSLQTVNFGVMSWQNQKEWYLQIKTVFILGWGKQTIKVWRHSEILGVEIYWPKVDDSAILSLFSQCDRGSHIPPNRQLWSDVLRKPKGMVPSN